MSVSAALTPSGTTGIGKPTAELLHSRGYRVGATGVTNVANAGLPDYAVIIRADARFLPDIDPAIDQARLIDRAGISGASE